MIFARFAGFRTSSFSTTRRMPGLRTSWVPLNEPEFSPSIGASSSGQLYSAFAMRINSALRSALLLTAGLRASLCAPSRSRDMARSKGSRRAASAYSTTPHAHASVSRPSYARPVTSSGAAYDSEPHSVVRRGCAGSMNRDKPKSESLIREAGGAGRDDENGEVVRRMSGER